jgi:hypothetical protein
VSAAPLTRQARLAVAAYSVVLLGTIIWGVVLSTSARDLQVEFDTKSRVLEDLRAEALPGIAPGASTRLNAPSLVISAPSETVAASILQKQILASLADSGGSIHSIHAEASNEVNAEGLRRLNAQLTYDSSIGSLQRLLFKLETAVPFIFIDSVAAHPAATVAPGTKLGDTLQVTLVASSYWKSVDASAADVQAAQPSTPASR